MDTPTKQRLVGAAILVALAVIFLPMLVKGPAPDSGVSDVPLEMPAEPGGDMETRDLPLVTPQAGAEGALGGAQPVDEERLPTVDTTDAAASQMQPAAVAGGDYAVHFGTYASTTDADTIVGQLRASQLPGYRERATLNGRTAWRVRIGPYETRADAESARLRAAHVRDDVGARVVVLDTAEDAAEPAAPNASASASQAAAAASTAAVTREALPPEPAAPEPPTPAPRPAAPSAPAAPTAGTAAADVGFAVQVGAFGNATEATRLRDRLRGAGFSAFTESVQTDKGMLTRVRVGPVLSRAEAERLKAQVSAKFGISGIVRPHP